MLNTLKLFQAKFIRSVPYSCHWNDYIFSIAIQKICLHSDILSDVLLAHSIVWTKSSISFKEPMSFFHLKILKIFYCLLPIKTNLTWRNHFVSMESTKLLLTDYLLQSPNSRSPMLWTIFCFSLLPDKKSFLKRSISQKPTRKWTFFSSSHYVMLNHREDNLLYPDSL